MRVEKLLQETATITSRIPTGARDSYGNVLTSTASRTTTCWHHETERDESDPLSVQTWSAYFPPGDPIGHTDQVTINGVSFEVVGEPWATLNPRTFESWQVEVTLRRTDG